MDKQYTLEDFTNNITQVIEDLSSWQITKIYRKNDCEDFKFLKWNKTHLDDVCPYGCDCGVKEYVDDFECKKLNIPYFVQQWSVGDSGDSYSGVMVFDLVDYYVEMSYSM